MADGKNHKPALGAVLSGLIVWFYVGNIKRTVYVVVRPGRIEGFFVVIITAVSSLSLDYNEIDLQGFVYISQRELVLLATEQVLEVFLYVVWEQVFLCCSRFCKGVSYLAMVAHFLTTGM